NWIRILDTPDPLLTTRPIDPTQDVGATTRRLSVTVPIDVTTALLTTVPTAFHAGIDDVLLTGLATAVTEWRRRQGQDGGGGLLVVLEGHGRIPLAEGVELSRTVGWFTNSYPVRLDPGAVNFTEVRAGGPAAGRAIKRIKELLRAVPGDGLGYGLLRYLNPDTAPQLANLPTPQIGFNYLGRFASGGAGEADQRMWQTVAQGLGDTDAQLPVMHPLEVTGAVHDLAEGPQLMLVMSWPADLFAESDVQALLDGWAAMLTGLATHTADSGGGGYTPSDFPLMELSQDELDEFEAAAKQIEEGA
ncbi:condensation domain-containing protein, partial [Plantactinospora solaniradicis]